MDKMNNQKIKFIFWGTPDIASKTLDILKSNGYLPSFIITSEDKPQGRKMLLTPPPVKVWAKENNIPYIQPEKLNKDIEDKIKEIKTDLSIVVAYGRIIPENFINLPNLGTINIHYSLLPKYRGASPLESALLNGDTITGVSIQQMQYKLDSGPIIADKKIEVNINDTKETLKEKLIILGGNLLSDILPDIENKSIEPKIQKEDDATFCKKIKKEDGEINLSDDGMINYNKYRAFYGWPSVYFFAFKNNQKIRVKITKAKYENNSFIIERVIPEGKKEINYGEFIRN